MNNSTSEIIYADSKNAIRTSSLAQPVSRTEDTIKITYGSTVFGGSVHELITKEAARLADMPYGNLVNGVQWPDFPSKKPEEVNYLGVLPKFGDIEKPGSITNESHHGKYQFWHSMAPTDRQYTNGEVQDKIIEQAVQWYEQAQSTGNTYDLGKVLHMIQDSYSRSHVMRDDNGKVKSFQNYNDQNSHEHSMDDMRHDKTVIESSGMKRQVLEDWQKVPGAMQALGASTDILKLYSSGANSKDLADYLRTNVYDFENEHTKDLPAGGTDPKYQKRIAETQDMPEIQAGYLTKSSLSPAENAPLKGTLREYLTQHHGSESAERIIVSMQESLSASLHSTNQNVEFKHS